MNLDCLGTKIGLFRSQENLMKNDFFGKLQNLRFSSFAKKYDFI